MVVLIMRVWRSTDRIELAWGAAGLVLALIGAWLIALRRAPGITQLRAAVDHHANAGGLIMAGAEYDLGAWRDQIQLNLRPRVHYNARKAMGMMLIAVAFVGGSFALPDDLTALTLPPTPLDVSDQVQNLNDKIETLKQEEVIDDEQAEALVEKLEDIMDKATGEDPTATWQKLDYIKDQLTRTADEAAEEALRETQMLTDLAAAAEAAEQAMTDPDAEGSELAGQMKELGELAKKALGESQKFKDLASDDWADAATDLAQLDEEALKKLAEMGPAGAKQAAELAKKMQEIDANCMVKVNAIGDVEVFDPDNQTTLKDIRGTAKLPTTHAVRMTSGAVFEYDAAVAMGLDLSAMGAGERIIALDDQLKDLAVYAKDFGPTPARDKLAHGGKEVVFTVDPSGNVERYVYDKAASAACKAGQCQGGDKFFRMMQADADAGQAQLQEMIEAMANEGLLDPQKMAEAMASCQKPGNGGVNRGRGDAPMTWRDPASNEGVEFKSEALPPSTLEALKNAERLGVSAGSHKPADGTEIITSGALGRAATEGGSAAKHTVLPRHRAAVEQYFQDE